LKGLASLTNLSDLTIMDNPTLVSLEGMDALESVGELSLRSNAVLASLAGARTLEVRERLDLDENPMLRSLQSLTGSTELSTVYLTGGALEDVEIMNGISHIDSLEIRNVPQLRSL